MVGVRGSVFSRVDGRLVQSENEIFKGQSPRYRSIRTQYNILTMVFHDESCLGLGLGGIEYLVHNSSSFCLVVVDINAVLDYLDCWQFDKNDNLITKTDGQNLFYNVVQYYQYLACTLVSHHHS